MSRRIKEVEGQKGLDKFLKAVTKYTPSKQKLTRPAKQTKKRTPPSTEKEPIMKKLNLDEKDEKTLVYLVTVKLPTKKKRKEMKWMLIQTQIEKTMKPKKMRMMLMSYHGKPLFVVTMCLTLKITTHGNRIPNIDSNDIFFKHLLTDLDLLSLDNCVYLDMEEYDKTTLKTDDLNVLQLNVCGLINKQAELNKILTDGSINKVNVALLCETWLRSQTKILINLPTYSYIGKERKGKKR